MTNDLLIGILAGILTSSVIYLFTLLTTRVLLPAVRNYLFQGPNISGHWNSYDSDYSSANAVGIAEISRKGENVTVHLTRHTSKLGRAINRKFMYKGRITGGQLTLLGDDTDMKGCITSAIVLKLEPNNKKFSGKSVYLDQEKNTVVAHDYWLQREN